MRVLLCHNHYLHRGGEDQVFLDEAELLEQRGCEVFRYVRRSEEAEQLSRLEIARRTLWNRQTFDEVRRLIRQRRPDVVHCTNIFPMISPAVYAAAQSEDVPVVQSLHNFRALCVNSFLLRNNRPCEACIGSRLPWRGILHACYRESRLASAIVAAGIGSQHRQRAKSDPVAVYVALSEFSRSRFVAGGFSPERLAVKPNFVAPDPQPGAGRGGYAVFVGRLAPEKGLEVLLDAWSQLPESLELKIVGDGPLEERVRHAAANDGRIDWLGRLPLPRVYEALGDASALILPSVCYENCPKTILEAYSKGTPAIVPRHGSLREFVRDQQTGFHFEPGNAADLVDKVQCLVREGKGQPMRPACRAEYEAKYTAEANFQMLMAIYRRAMNSPIPNQGRPPTTNGGEPEIFTHSAAETHAATGCEQQS